MVFSGVGEMESLGNMVGVAVVLRAQCLGVSPVMLSGVQSAVMNPAPALHAVKQPREELVERQPSFSSSSLRSTAHPLTVCLNCSWI